MTKYIPFFILILCNFLFLIVNLIDQKFFTINKIFNDRPFNFIKKIEDKYYYNDIIKNIEINFSKIGKNNPKSNYIFIVPDRLLEAEKGLILTKEFFKNSQEIIIESTTNSSLIYQISDPSYKTDSNLYSIAPIQSLADNTFNKNIYVYGQIKDIDNLSISLKNQLNMNRITKESILANRILVSMKHLYLLSKLGIFAAFDKNWSYKNLSMETEINLYTSSSELIEMATKDSYYFILSQFSNKKTSSIFNSYENYNSGYYIHLFDKTLNSSISGLVNSGVKKIYLIPLSDTNKKIKISIYFTVEEETDNNIKTYSTLLNPMKNTGFSCLSKKNILMNNGFENLYSTMENKIKFDRNGHLYLDAMFNTYIKAYFNNEIVCLSDEKIPYLLIRNDSYKENFESNYQTSNTVFNDIFQIEYENKKNDTIKSASTDNSFNNYNFYEISKNGDNKKLTNEYISKIYDKNRLKISKLNSNIGDE